MLSTRQHKTTSTANILICDYIGLKFGPDGQPDCSEVRAYIESKGGIFHHGPIELSRSYAPNHLHFFYQPNLKSPDEILAQTVQGHYQAVIAAATPIPPQAVFAAGGVRIGAGTGNMASLSWGGGNGEGGSAVLMNTPGFNAEATAQMLFKTLLQILPDLPLLQLHQLVLQGRFDTGLHLKNVPTEKLAGKKIAILGYGHIGKRVAKLASAFGLRVSMYARPHHQTEIRAAGYHYAPSPEAAAMGADILTSHVGLGPYHSDSRTYANHHIINAAVLAGMNGQSVLMNFDRGELVDIAALEQALASGQLRFAAIDADIFVDAETAALSGPLAAYVPVARQFPEQLLLLPHVAADTDHPSRVAGAKQAVNQIFALLQEGRVINLKGTLPAGLHDAGAITG